MPDFVTPSVSASGRRLRRLRLACVSLALAAVAVVATAGTVFAWDASAFSPADEQLLFALTNQDRASAGLNALVNDSYLHKEAEWRAHDMGVRDYFSHQIPPDNKMVFDYMTADGYCFKVAGENIAVSTYGDDVATANIEVGFMGSPTHRENILGTWADMGVGAYKAADGKKYYDVLFSIPCSVTVATPTPATTRAPTPAPTRKPTPRPTARPIATAVATEAPSTAPTPGATPSDSSTQAFANPTPGSRSSSAPSDPSKTATPPPGGLVMPATPASGGPTSLRVYQQPVSQGPIGSLFLLLFGGLFGW
ncbi:MAG: CAP domain-containing protein [Candidatus Limnocylindrales bacterium]